MPAWPGGPCPQCGEEMPEKLVHCQNCRALLNSDLQVEPVRVPEFFALREIGTMLEVEPRGFFIHCPGCRKELRISRRYLGEMVGCRFCQEAFRFELGAVPASSFAFYATCPHCEKELRASGKYLGQRVACKHCSGQLQMLTGRVV